MTDATLLNIIATGHALKHADQKEPWTCQCIACRFTKEYKLKVQSDNGEIKDMTLADAIITTLNNQGLQLSL